MKVCNKTIPAETKLIGGNIYRQRGSDLLYIYCTRLNVLINVGTGNPWSVGNGVAEGAFEDVTNQYCLTKVKE